MAEWQTRTFKGRVGDRTGSSPVFRTKDLYFSNIKKRGRDTSFFYLAIFFSENTEKYIKDRAKFVTNEFLKEIWKN